MSKARELAELSRTVADSADAVAITINSDEEVTFASGIDVTGSVTATGTSVFASLDISGDIDVDGTTNLDAVDIDGAVDMASTLAVGGNITQGNGDYLYTGGGNFDIKHTTAGQNIVFSTTPSGGSTAETLRITSDGKLSKITGDLTLDVAGDIILDADGGDVRLADGGTQFARLSDGTEFTLSAMGTDKDIKFAGNDGGVAITALTLDMSAAGEATFNAGIKLSDGNAASFGADGDLLVYHSSNENIIQANTSDQDLLFKGKDGASTITALTLDMSAAGAATFNAGATFGGPITLTAGALAAAGNAGLSHRSTDNKVYLQAGTGGFNILDDQQNTHFFIDSAGAATFSSNIATTTGNITLGQTTTFPTTGLISHTNNYLYMEGGSGGIILRTASGSSQMMFITAAEVVVNNDSADMDFRVESDSQTHMLFVDASTNRIGIQTSAPDAEVHISGTSPHIDLGPQGSNRAKIGYASTNLYLGTTSGGGEVIIKNNIGSTDAPESSGDEIARFGDTIVFNEGSRDQDFRVESDTNANALFMDASTSYVGINRVPAVELDIQRVATSYPLRISSPDGSARTMVFADSGTSPTRVNWLAGAQYNTDNGWELTPATANGGYTFTNRILTAYANGDLTVNENGIAADFRVESDSQSHMFFVDGGVNGIGIGTNSVFDHQQGSALDISYDGSIWAGNTYWAGGLRTGTTFYTTTSGDKYKHSNRQAVQHYQNSQGGSHHFYSAGGGTAGDVISWQELAEFDRDEVVFNNNSHNQDFRVESDTNANMLHVDGNNNGVGIGTTGTTTPLTVNGGSASAATIQLGNHGDNASIHAKYNLAFKADSTEAIADRGISFGIGTTASLGLTTSESIFNDLGANIDFRVESADNQYALFVDGGNNDIISGALNGNRNTALSDKRAGTTGLQLNRPGEDDEGGHLFMTETAVTDTWMDIVQCHDDGATGVLFLIHGVRAADQNRSYAALVRYAYQDAFNIMSVSSQNATVEYRVSGNALQYRFTTAGPYIVNLTVMAAG